MSEYDTQAETFLQRTGVTVIKELIGNRKYFEGDTESRDVYMIYFKRGNTSMAFTFGQSLANSTKELSWRIIRKAPSNYDILSCLYQPVEGFSDFCSEYCYDEDSIKVRKVYDSCVDLNQKLVKFFKPDELYLLSEIQ